MIILTLLACQPDEPAPTAPPADTDTPETTAITDTDTPVDDTALPGEIAWFTNTAGAVTDLSAHFADATAGAPAVWSPEQDGVLTFAAVTAAVSIAVPAGRTLTIEGQGASETVLTGVQEIVTADGATVELARLQVVDVGKYTGTAMRFSDSDLSLSDITLAAEDPACEGTALLEVSGGTLVGDAVRISETFTLYGCSERLVSLEGVQSRLSGFEATLSAGGDGLLVVEGGTLILEGADLDLCGTDEGMPALVLMSTAAVITGSVLTDGSGPLGGAIHVEDSVVHIEDSTLSGNYGFSPRDGGGWGGVLWASGSVVTLKDTDLTDNIAYREGGVFYVLGGSIVTLESCQLSGNTAGWGGAFYLVDGQVTGTNTTLSGNSPGDIWLNAVEQEISLGSDFSCTESGC